MGNPWNSCDTSYRIHPINIYGWFQLKLPLIHTLSKYQYIVWTPIACFFHYKVRPYTRYFNRKYTVGFGKFRKNVPLQIYSD